MPSLSRAAAVGSLIAVMSLTGFARTAHASDTQLSIMQDDDHLLYDGDNVRDATLKKMKSLGADMVRVTVLWSTVADQIDTKPANARQAKVIKANHKRFAKLGASNPKAYPKGNWDKYDRLDRACKTDGLICYFDVTGPGPDYSHPAPPKKYAKDAHWWKPSPKAFYSFVQAVGKRYSGTYSDENDQHVTLPAIRVWSLWNEPNQGGWLRPQWLNGKAVSPSLYRNLYTYGLRALISTGHDPSKADQVFIGETAPINVTRKTTTSAMGPKIFINELLCGPGSNGLGCGTFAKSGPLVATAWAHHPYTKRISPLESDPDPNAITMHNLSDLGTQLDGLSSTGHIRSGLPYISTEYGYETNPPDPTATTSFAQQSQYLELGDYITEQNPRVLGNTQFLLYDAKPNKHYKAGSRNYWGTYQSGLYNAAGNVAKTAASTYPFPFLAIPGTPDPTTGAHTFTAWGQIRFAPDIAPGTSVPVTLEYSGDAVNWTPVGPIDVTNVKGYFEQPNVPVPGPGLVRISYAGFHSAPQAVQ